MKYLKKLIPILLYLLSIYILQFIIIIITTLILGKEKAIITGTIFLCIFELLYIIYKYRKEKIKVSKAPILPYISLGIGVSSIYNMIIFKMNLGIEANTNINILINLLASSLIGPIFEEVLFRYILINKLKYFNNKVLSILISSLIFSLFHTGVITIIYAFIIGLINSYLYVKKNNILIPILIHIGANTIATFLNNYNGRILLLSTLLLVISIFNIKEKES